MSKKSRPQRRGNCRSKASDGGHTPAGPTPMPPRTTDWKARLVDYLAGSVATPFACGTFDCATFTFAAVAVMTGHDLAAPYRDRYSTIADGIALLRQDGFRDHVDLVAAHFAEMAPAFAQAGDIAVLDGADGAALGLVQGEHIYALLPTGMALVPLLSARRAFRVA